MIKIFSCLQTIAKRGKNINSSSRAFQQVIPNYTQKPFILESEDRCIITLIRAVLLTAIYLSFFLSVIFFFIPFHRSFLFCHQYYIFFSDSCSNPALNMDEKKRIPEAISIADRLQTVLYYRIIKCPCAGITKLTVMEMSLTAKK